MSYRTKPLRYAAAYYPKTDFYCAVCRKDLNPHKPYRMVHIVDGGSHVIHPEDETAYTTDAGDCGCHPIGSDCARKLGLEWSWLCE